jgi:hypothetical protein
MIEVVMGQRIAIMTPSISLTICISIQEMNDMNQESPRHPVPEVHEPSDCRVGTERT